MSYFTSNIVSALRLGPPAFFISGPPASSPCKDFELIQVKASVLGGSKGSLGGGHWEVKRAPYNVPKALSVLDTFEWAQPPQGCSCSSHLFSSFSLSSFPPCSQSKGPRVKRPRMCSGFNRRRKPGLRINQRRLPGEQGFTTELGRRDGYGWREGRWSAAQIGKHIFAWQIRR